MKSKIILILLILISQLIAKTPSKEKELKPFGITLNKSLNKSLNIKKEGNIIIVLNPPKPVNLFNLYAVLLKNNKVMTVIAVGNTYFNDDYCFSSQQDFAKVEKILTKKYGKPTNVQNYLSYDAIWSEPRYYKMSIIKNERFHYTEWNNIKEYPNQRIYLEEDANDDGCYIKLMYKDKRLNKENEKAKEKENEEAL
jgi:hypothetical protein